MIALEHLQVINVIHQEGSFRKASERLFKARSAVSYSVKQVEHYYGIEIFNRDTYRPELTRDGKLLVDKIQHLLDEAGKFDRFARQINAEVETELRVGIAAIFPIEKVTRLLKQLKQSFPETIIHLNIEVASGERMLLDDLVDIGIYGGFKQNPDVHYKLIEQCRLPAFISARSQLVEKGKPKLKDLSDFPQIVVKSSYKSSPDTGIIKDGIPWYVSDQHTKRMLVHEGLGWGRLPMHEAKKDIEAGKLVTLDCVDVMDVPVYIAHRKDRVMGPVAMEVWEFFSDSQK